MVKYEDFTVGDIQSHSQWNVCRGQVQSVKPEERNRAEPTSRSRHVTNTFSFCHQTWTHRVLNDEQERSTWGDGNHTVGLWTRHNSELNQRQHSPVGGTSGGRTRTLGFCGAVEAGPCGQTVYWWRTPGPEGREEPGSQHTEPESGAPEPPSEEEENNVRTTDEKNLVLFFIGFLQDQSVGWGPAVVPGTTWWRTGRGSSSTTLYWNWIRSRSLDLEFDEMNRRYFDWMMKRMWKQLCDWSVQLRPDWGLDRKGSRKFFNITRLRFRLIRSKLWTNICSLDTTMIKKTQSERIF